MKALDLLNELRSQITSKPDKGQEKVFYEKYANTKPDHFKEAPAMLENYGVSIAASVIQAMTDCERDRQGNSIVATIPFSSINARTYMLIEILPKMSVSSVMGYLKGKN